MTPGRRPAVARVDDVTIAETVREALAIHVAARCRDPDFQKRLEQRLESDAAVLRELRKGG